MFLVELHAIPDLTFEGWGLLVQALAVEFVPDLGRCLPLLVLVRVGVVGKRLSSGFM